MSGPALPALNRRVWFVGGGVAALLVATSNGYGYHRDELYFVATGQHLAWGYPDQPPLVALVARLMSELAPGSLAALRFPSALVAMTVVLVTGLLARELGAGRGAQLLAAASMAVASVLLGGAHLLHTTTFDLLAWPVVLWLVLRVLRTGNQRLWLLVGMAAGVGLLNKMLVAFLMAALVAGIAIAGPRRSFASPWLWLGGVIALVLWSPYLIWQAQHGWPQLDVASNIAGGGSGTSAPRALFVPYQLGLVSPFLAPVWVAGLVRLFRDPALRWCRAVGWAYLLLLVVYVVTGGKPYYLAGMFPVLLAAGAQPAVDWLRRGRVRLRRAAVAAAFALSAPAVIVTLPVVPVADLHRTPIADWNFDAGEQVGWPNMVAQIAGVYSTAPPGAVVIGQNYGEAGAVDRYGRTLGLPLAYSGHNAYWYWGPPPDSATTAVAIGFERDFLERAFREVELALSLDNGRGIDNDEQDAPVWICSGRRASWDKLWPMFRR